MSCQSKMCHFGFLWICVDELVRICAQLRLLFEVSDFQLSALEVEEGS